MANAAKFYIVFSPDGPSAPTLMHPTHKAACGVAWAMARQFPDQTFHVMGTAGRPALASRIEARSDATGTGAAEGESLIGAAETPETPPHNAEHPAPAKAPASPPTAGGDKDQVGNADRLA